MPCKTMYVRQSNSVTDMLQTDIGIHIVLSPSRLRDLSDNCLVYLILLLVFSTISKSHFPEAFLPPRYPDKTWVTESTRGRSHSTCQSLFSAFLILAIFQVRLVASQDAGTVLTAPVSWRKTTFSLLLVPEHPRRAEE